MKYSIVLIFVLSFFSQISFSEAQNQDSIFVSCKRWGGDIEIAENWKWKINGVEFKLTPDTLKIPIHKSDFDTILFSDGNKERIILTKFNKGHVYGIHYNYCCNGFAITEKNDYYDSLAKIEDVMMSYYIHLKEPRVRFKLLNSKKNDKLVGVFGHLNEVVSARDLRNNKVTNYTSPSYFGFSTYAYEIGIVRRAAIPTEEDRDKYMYVHFELSKEDEYGAYKIEKIFQMVEYRFFGKERLLVTYDYQTNKMKVEIEDK